VRVKEKRRLSDMISSGAFFLAENHQISSSSLFPSLVARTGHKLFMLMFPHLFFPFFDHASHSITSIRYRI
jgi:hypothetical protein